MYAFINNEILPLKNAVIHVSDLAIQRGFGVFDFFKISNGHPYFLNTYLDRFYHSASLMKLTVPVARPDLVKIIHDLIKKNSLRESGMKLILTGGYSVDGFQPSNPNLIVTQQEFALPSADQVGKGVPIITHEYVREFAEAKTINYSMGIWLIDKVRNEKAFDVLYHKDGIVSEFPRSNFFMVTANNTIVTPNKNVLAGVTRKNIIALGAKHFNVEVRDVTLRDIHYATEAFITSTTKRIVPIISIDHRAIGKGKPGPVTQSLLKHLMDLEKEDEKVAYFHFKSVPTT
jgi:branched-chain amino acid aminotransferase